MKNIFKFSALLACLAMIGLASCTQEELSTDQYSDGTVAFGAFGPNPVVRGDTLTILGSNLEKVKEVRLPGVDPVTEFAEVVAGPKGQLKVVVPVEGPEDAPVTGIVSIVDQNGTVFSSTTELTYTEGIKITSIAPAEVLPGDIVTIKGDYLYNTREVVFVSGNKDGKSYVVGEAIKATRYELKVAVPADAISGAVMLGDVDETNNPDGLLPNTAYTSEITVKDPTVTAFAKTTFKAGAAVEISGAYLNMIETVKFVGADVDVADFKVAADAKKLTVVLPAKANDGAVTAVSYAGKEFAAGEIETVRPTEMAVAAETRYKAGLNAVVTGKDLDLVTGVKVAGVDATFSTTAEKTTVVIPAESADGDVVLSLANGNTVTAGAVEVVKPVIESLSVASVVAGVDSLMVKGTDLDLVTAVAISEQPCEFKLEGNDIKVYVSKAAFTGDLVVTAANECTSKAQIEVTYDESVSIEYVKNSVSIGGELKLTGKNLDQIEAISIRDNKVTQYTRRTKDELSFLLPEGIVSPGFCTLDLTLISGETLTWAVPFEVTASFKLVPLWEGTFDAAADWSTGVQDLAWGGFDWSTVAPGTIIQFTAAPLDPAASWWCISLRHGDSWGNIPGLPGQYDNATILEVEFTKEVLDDLIAHNGLVVTGTGFRLTQIAMKIPEAPEFLLWEGEAVADDWKDQPYVMSDGGKELLDLDPQPGQSILFYAEPLSSDWKLEIVEGHWGPTYKSFCASGIDTGDGAFTENGKFTEYDLEANDGKIKIEVTKEMLDAASKVVGWGGVFVLNGDNIKVTKVTLQ